MKILVACEYSGIVRDAFARLGHNAISCDILPTESQGQHYQGDVRDILFENWDMIIAHPPCTYLSATGSKWFYHPDDKDIPRHKRRPHPKFPERKQKQNDAIDFFMLFANHKCERICIENPVGIISSIWRKPDQIVQPYEFGHKEPKKTCLWLKGLPNLIPTEIVEPEYHTTKSGKRMPKWYAYADKKDRSKTRSKTFQGIADAMALQWGFQ